MPQGFYRAEGFIKNVNTIEEYRNLDKGAIIHQSGRTVSHRYSTSKFKRRGTNTSNKIWDAINDGTIYSCPSLLASFSVISFADLKKYKFTYQFAFPVLHSGHFWRLESKTVSKSVTGDEGQNFEGSVVRLTGPESAALVERVQTWRYSVDARQYGFFIAKKIRGRVAAKSNEASAQVDARPQSSHRPTTPETPNDSLGYSWEVGSLADYHNGFFDGVYLEDRYVCFADPSTYSTYPGWILRNLLVLIRRRWQLRKVQILCYRDLHAHRDEAQSIILRLEASDIDTPVSTTSEVESTLPDMPKVTGWERNAAGRVTSKIANLGEYMDPQRYENIFVI